MRSRHRQRPHEFRSDVAGLEGEREEEEESFAVNPLFSTWLESGNWKWIEINIFPISSHKKTCTGFIRVRVAAC